MQSLIKNSLGLPENQVKDIEDEVDAKCDAETILFTVAGHEEGVNS